MNIPTAMAQLVRDAVNTFEQKVLGKGTTHPAPPTEPSSDDVKELREKYEKAGQGQVFAFYDELDTAGKAQIYEQLAGFDPEHINELVAKVLHPPSKESSNEAPSIEPLPESATCSVMDSEEEDLKKWYEQGLDLIAENKVGVVLMAGGQGTRLGSSAPKGCFDIGLPSH